MLAKAVGLFPPGTKGIAAFRFHCFRKNLQTVLEEKMPLNWVDLALCHTPRGSSAESYTRPSEDKLREAYSEAADKLMVYGRQPVPASEEMRRLNKLENYWFAIEELFGESREKVMQEEGKRFGGKPNEEEELQIAKEKLSELRALTEFGVDKLYGRDGDNPISDEGEFETKDIPRAALQSYLDQGWEPGLTATATLALPIPEVMLRTEFGIPHLSHHSSCTSSAEGSG